MPEMDETSKYYAVWTSTKGQRVHDSTYMDFPGGSDSKASAYNAGDPGSIPGLGRSSGEGNGKPLQYSCLENPMEGEHGRLQSMGLQRVGHDWATLLTYHLYEFPRIGKFIEIENRVVVESRPGAGAGQGKWWNACLMRRVSVWDDEKFCKWIVVMYIQHCECT